MDVEWSEGWVVVVEDPISQKKLLGNYITYVVRTNFFVKTKNESKQFPFLQIR